MNTFYWLRTTMVAAASLSLTALVAPSVLAADEVRLSLTGLIEELSTRNPEIKAARARWEAAKAIVPQVQTLTDPRLQLGYQRMPMTDPLQGAMYGFGEEIPFPGKLRLKGEIARETLSGWSKNTTRLGFG